jgi:putative hydrolases of HD superfamily
MERMDRLTGQLDFVAEAGRLKGVLRQTMLTDPARRENSAEHSWHLAVMALALAEHAPPGTDLGRVVAMLVLHDVVEIDAGDLFVYAGQAEHARQLAAERAAADRIFALLPADQASRLRQLWEEFEERATPEARFARALDRFQPMLENLNAGGGTWAEHGITADQVLANVALIEDGSAELGRRARQLVAGAVRDGLLAPARAPEG